MPDRPRLCRPFAAALAASALSACAAPQSAPSIVADGGRALVPIGVVNVVSAAPPAGSRLIETGTWAWPVGSERAIVLRVHRSDEPAGGGDAYVDSLVQALGKGGRAGVERDARIRLGDLDARRIDAATLRERPPIGLWMVIAAAEDGLYTATAYGLRDDLRARQVEIDAYLASLRVEAPTPPRPAVAPDPDDPTPAVEPAPRAP